jgi:predicted GIY-YIG superfamily endonuclease
MKTAIRSYKTGTVYLIHFESKLHHAQHYIGFASHDLFARIRDHRNNHGARLLQVLNGAGVQWHVVRTWRGTRQLERRFKRRKKASALCPICREATEPPVSEIEMDKILQEGIGNR